MVTSGFLYVGLYIERTVEMFHHIKEMIIVVLSFQSWKIFLDERISAQKVYVQSCLNSFTYIFSGTLLWFCIMQEIWLGP